jgi:hypothetical protein
MLQAWSKDIYLGDMNRTSFDSVAVPQMVEALSYKPEEGRGFVSRWGNLVFFFSLPNPSIRTMALEFTHPVTDFFLNPILFANCTVTFSNWCNVVEACRGELCSTPPYRTGSRPLVSLGNNVTELSTRRYLCGVKRSRPSLSRLSLNPIGPNGLLQRRLYFLLKCRALTPKGLVM